MQQRKFPGVGRRKLDATNGKEKAGNSDEVKMHKKRQYCRIAQFMGMKELQFSKWILSATPAEREKVLKDYKKRKEKVVNG